MGMGGGGGRWKGGGVFSQWGRWVKTSVQTFSNRFLKTKLGSGSKEEGFAYHNDI